MQCTQTEVVLVFVSFNCDDFGSHSTKPTNSPISTNQNTSYRTPEGVELRRASDVSEYAIMPQRVGTPAEVLVTSFIFLLNKFSFLHNRGSVLFTNFNSVLMRQKTKNFLIAKILI